jgi:hypothetical protein
MTLSDIKNRNFAGTENLLNEIRRSKDPGRLETRTQSMNWSHRVLCTESFVHVTSRRVYYRVPSTLELLMPKIEDNQTTDKL